MIGKQIPVRVENVFNITKIIYKDRDGAKVYELPDGRVVKVWQEYPNCLRCGRPLTSRKSRALGVGPCCRNTFGKMTKLIIYAEKPA